MLYHDKGSLSARRNTELRRSLVVLAVLVQRCPFRVRVGAAIVISLGTGLKEYMPSVAMLIYKTYKPSLSPR